MSRPALAGSSGSPSSFGAPRTVPGARSASGTVRGAELWLARGEPLDAVVAADRWRRRPRCGPSRPRPGSRTPRRRPEAPKDPAELALAGEPLDAVVFGVRHVDEAGAVDRHLLRGTELPVAGVELSLAAAQAAERAGAEAGNGPSAPSCKHTGRAGRSHPRNSRRRARTWRGGCRTWRPPSRCRGATQARQRARPCRSV